MAAAVYGRTGLLARGDHSRSLVVGTRASPLLRAPLAASRIKSAALIQGLAPRVVQMKVSCLSTFMDLDPPVLIYMSSDEIIGSHRFS